MIFLTTELQSSPDPGPDGTKVETGAGTYTFARLVP
ncbi:unnamed protein product, partial [Rotaria magnacalcarata]